MLYFHNKHTHTHIENGCFVGMSWDEELSTMSSDEELTFSYADILIFFVIYTAFRSLYLLVFFMVIGNFFFWISLPRGHTSEQLIFTSFINLSVAYFYPQLNQTFQPYHIHWLISQLSWNLACVNRSFNAVGPWRI